MDTEECTYPHPLAMQSSVFRVKHQAVAGAFLFLGLVAAATSIYSAMQLAALSAAQDVNVYILQEHETRLTVNERSIALINSTVIRMGKKVASLSDIYLHIPVYKIDSQLQLLEHVPVPLILPGMVRQTMGKGYRNTAMFVQPPPPPLPSWLFKRGGRHLKYSPWKSWLPTRF
jgi:hypothetical protein